ncbi:MAG: hypothetical protein JSU63_10230 [Phycisphaerales bacterium]|nr:MAG: hypothetical protein JSU63_10230 [Phycisphaerales bacterium]
MSKLDIALEQSEAKQLAEELKKTSSDCPIEVRELSTRGLPEASAAVSIGLEAIGALGGAVALVDILLRFVASRGEGYRMEGRVDGNHVVFHGESRDTLIKILKAMPSK